jgi:S-adenosylmethionine synthetase
LRELSERFGLSHPDSASDIIRRGAKQLAQSKEMTRQLRAIEEKLETPIARR